MRKLGLTLATVALVLPFAVPTKVAHAASGDIIEFSLPRAESYSYSITSGPDGSLWFTEAGGNSIGRITPAGAITEHSLPTPRSNPGNITLGPDGNLWFTELGGDRIGRITPAGAITEFPLPTANSTPQGITAGPDGNLWFTENNGNRIGRITPAGAITEFPIPTRANSIFPYPSDITAGPDGNLWFVQANYYGIGRITPAGVITEFPLPGVDSNPSGITLGPDGNLWFTAIEQGGDRIGRITPAGAITEFRLPTANSLPQSITAGPDGNLWFTEWTNRIGRITPAGAITEFSVPTANSSPWGIAAGPDDNVWFTELDGNRIGRVEVNPSTTQPPVYKCGTYHFFGLRGSDGPGNHATDGHGMGNEIDATRLSLQKYFPGLEYEAVPYDAIGVNLWKLDYWRSEYQASEYTGVVQLQKQLRTFFRKCKKTYAVIAGYSQGADVVGDVYGGTFGTLTGRERRQIGAVIMLGDPRFVYTKKLSTIDYGDFDQDLVGIFNLGVRNPHGFYYNKRLLNRVFDVCTKGDPVCNNSGFNVAGCVVTCAHTEYILRGWTRFAALLAASRLKKLGQSYQ